MGCGQSVDDTTKSIDKMLKEEKKRLDKEIKLLLLGTGEAGKSTFAKQMRILYLGGFDNKECIRYRYSIWLNVLDSCKKLAEALRRLQLPISDELGELVAYFDGIDLVDDIEMSAEMSDKIRALWADETIQQVYSRRAEYQLNDNTAYFFSRMEDIGNPEYIPTQDDILHLRIKTTGVLETCFQVKGQAFRMVDVGGQRNERRKWVSCFEDVTCVVFLVAMSEYDMTMEEQEGVNRMKESLKVFKDVINNDWFKNTTIILFLNKEDLFAEKIKNVDLNVCFQSYKDGKDETKAKEYIRKRFLALNENHERLVNAFFTCATDTKNASKVFNTVREDVILTALRNAKF